MGLETLGWQWCRIHHPAELFLAALECSTQGHIGGGVSTSCACASVGRLQDELHTHLILFEKRYGRLQHVANIQKFHALDHVLLHPDIHGFILICRDVLESLQQPVHVGVRGAHKLDRKSNPFQTQPFGLQRSFQVFEPDRQRKIECFAPLRMSISFGTQGWSPLFCPRRCCCRHVHKYLASQIFNSWQQYHGRPSLHGLKSCENTVAISTKLGSEFIFSFVRGTSKSESWRPFSFQAEVRIFPGSFFIFYSCVLQVIDHRKKKRGSSSNWMPQSKRKAFRTQTEKRTFGPIEEAVVSCGDLGMTLLTAGVEV